MNDSEEDYEAMIRRLKEANEKILAGFIKHSIENQKRGKKLVARHADHLRFFANEYLANYNTVNLLDGIGCFTPFACDWFIRKCTWSDPNSLRENFEAYSDFVSFLGDTQQLTPEELSDLKAVMKIDLPTALLRVKYYNDDSVDIEDIMDEFGGWNDDFLESMENKDSQPTALLGTGTLNLNLLLSAKAAKFFKIKPPQLVSMKSWEKTWGDPSHHWISNWRCEECFRMKGTKKRVFMVTNEACRYSFLLSLEPGDVKGLFSTLHGKIMAAIKACGSSHPSRVQLLIYTLSGQARSLTSFQNQQIYHLDFMLDGGDYEFLDDLEPRLNHTPTTIQGEIKIVDREFVRLCMTAPPFDGGDDDRSNVIPFMN